MRKREEEWGPVVLGAREASSPGSAGEEVQHARRHLQGRLMLMLMLGGGVYT